MLCHVVEQDPAFSFFVIAAYVEDIPRRLQHDGYTVQLRMTGVEDVTAHVKPSW